MIFIRFLLVFDCLDCQPRGAAAYWRFYFRTNSYRRRPLPLVAAYWRFYFRTNSFRRWPLPLVAAYWRFYFRTNSYRRWPLPLVAGSENRDARRVGDIAVQLQAGRDPTAKPLVAGGEIRSISEKSF